MPSLRTRSSAARQGCWTIMIPLGGAKGSFLVCLGISTLICSLIYLRAWTQTELQPQVGANGCRSFSDRCEAFLPRVEEGLIWRNRDCQVDSYIHNNHLTCSQLIADLHFITKPLSQEELDYPLAFILTVHKELQLLLRLLRAIYAPQNVYCIHIDAKAPQDYQQMVRRLVACLPNVFLSSQSETVTYAGFSRLQADIHCMRDLEHSKVGWKKLINLCGQDFPVQSNLELVRYMQSKMWKDRNMTPGIKQPASMRHRTQLQHKEITGSHVGLKGWGKKKGHPPQNMQLYFGTAYYALTRGFVNFVLKSRVAQDLLEWSKDTYSPDEHYWATLNHLKEAPGNHVDGGWEGDIRAIKWQDQEGTVHSGCKGRYVRNICIYGIEDLPWIIKRNSMFANKFESSTFPESLDCLEQWHRRKVLRQARVPIDPEWLLAVPYPIPTSKTNSSGGQGNRLNRSFSEHEDVRGLIV
ncbi:beta-1,3-galactosyl-O-glycosyl-glycoprotein beta-1,6-N-acetylglucosaminyltransferase 7 isoform X1 [Gadus macrocephalus]|uniref:beta-1,3-galactosyl-O-glycosyl-glycoprotein beta-1,6-N-acetylglucosaminyltransferase 7 isoform X1 n=1 Tax=Gadus macrocephalus TaxID=80720 RepID=UPI0028CBB764|nr:beta-1,3-galactosyl-O-glycosyl-glycoprotein beta-1,6-N-acetylglucosaminyltransferase 7 isoform X1 [Gadus macrocephalus]XP_059926378.1 beta-1,3-galactosyl-O-glycosyl-glycoprotein beta-1,6-N-acetylglucosaminyltransferase 7 isoform X1 [Gadus macrocephalus]